LAAFGLLLLLRWCGAGTGSAERARGDTVEIQYSSVDYCRGLLEMNQNNRSLDQKNKIGRLTLQGDAPCNVAKGW
jgi:hypothetical protein